MLLLQQIWIRARNPLSLRCKWTKAEGTWAVKNVGFSHASGVGASAFIQMLLSFFLSTLTLFLLRKGSVCALISINLYGALAWVELLCGWGWHKIPCVNNKERGKHRFIRSKKAYLIKLCAEWEGGLWAHPAMLFKFPVRPVINPGGNLPTLSVSDLINGSGECD